MSRWTHAICHECWDDPDLAKAMGHPERVGRQPHWVRDAGTERCCFCGGETAEGIYVRHDPANLECAGAHDDR